MRYTCFFIFSLISHFATSQADSIFAGGSYRNFILHLPSGYNSNFDYPIVINMHGLGSSAFEQQLYSQFDGIANTQDFIVAYPDAINNNWDLFGTNDTEFIDQLVDSLRQRYSANNCLFFMGMSQGGFMSYKFACEFPKTVTAIASVTGTMTTPLQIGCDPSHAIPVMQLHGTADLVVPYNGTFGIPPIEETIEWWVNKNNCNATPIFTNIPNTDPNDGSTAELYYYQECDKESEVIFYKLINGGHSWPGAFPIPAFGNTNQDINASELIGDFFSSHCTSTTSVNDSRHIPSIYVYPNPGIDILTIEWPGNTFDVMLFNMNGKKVFHQNDISVQTVIDCTHLIAGVYILQLFLENGQIVNEKILISK